VRAFVENLRYFSLAESLGGVESLVCHPSSMTHAPVSDAALSIGLEASEDLVSDVLEALEAAASTSSLRPVAAGFG
jgi:cystathionine gamma-synthase